MDKRLKQVIVGFAVLGLLVSIYMTIYKLTNNESMCIGSGGCSIVNASGYSEVNGIPVAAIGVFGYLSILAFFGSRKQTGVFSRKWQHGAFRGYAHRFSLHSLADIRGSRTHQGVLSVLYHISDNHDHYFYSYGRACT